MMRMDFFELRVFLRYFLKLFVCFRSFVKFDEEGAQKTTNFRGVQIER